MNTLNKYAGKLFKLTSAIHKATSRVYRVQLVVQARVLHFIFHYSVSMEIQEETAALRQQIYQQHTAWRLFARLRLMWRDVDHLATRRDEM